MREWTSLFSPTRLETANLLDVLSVEGRGVLLDFLAGELVTIDLLVLDEPVALNQGARIERDDAGDMEVLRVSQGDTQIALVPAWHHADVSALLETGLEFSATVVGEAGAVQLAMQMAQDAV
jgi:hypothetical protein